MDKVLNEIMTANLKLDMKRLVEDLAKLSTDDITDRFVKICEKYGSNVFSAKKTNSGNLSINFTLSLDLVKKVLLGIYNNI